MSDQSTAAIEATRFVTLFESAGAARHLSQLLQSHPEIATSGDGMATIKKRGRQARAQLAWCKRALTPPTDRTVRAVGFRTTTKTVEDPAAFKALLSELRTSIIILERRNVVKLAVTKIDRKRHKKASKHGTEAAAQTLPPLEILPEELLTVVEDRARQQGTMREFVADIDVPKLVIAYEDLIAHQQRTLEEIFDFIGVPKHDIDLRVPKSTDVPLRESLGNYDAVRAAFKDTPYGPMLDEDEATTAAT